MDAKTNRKHFSSRDLFRILFKWKWRFLALSLLTPILVCAAAYLLPPSYAASGRIIVIGQSSEGVSGMVKPVNLHTEEVLNTEMAILASRNIAAVVVDRLKLDQPRPRRSGAGRAISDAVKSVKRSLIDIGLLDEVDLRTAAIKGLMKSLQVEAIPISNVIKVTYTAADPSLAADVVNAVMDAYFERRIQLVRTAGASEFYQKQAEEFRKELAALRKRRHALKVSWPEAVAPSSAELIQKEMQGMRVQLRAAEADLAEARQKIKTVRSQSSYAPFNNREGGYEILDSAGNRLLELEIQRIKLARSRQPDSQELGLVNQQIKHLKTQIITSLEAIENSLSARIGQFTEQIQQLQEARKKGVDYQAQIEELGSGIRRAEQSQEHYMDLAEKSRLNEIRNASLGSARPLDYATPPRAPTHPRLLSVLIGLVAGLFAGLIYVLLSEYFDDRLESAEQAMELLGVRVYAVIPNIRGLRR